MWSVKHLYDHVYSKVRVPIVFDYHHHRFCTAGLSEQEALDMAVSTWQDIVPVVHVSESRAEEQGDPKIRPQAHSDYVNNPVNTYGHEVDIMLECKKKELGVLRYRKVLKERNNEERHNRIDSSQINFAVNC